MWIYRYQRRAPIGMLRGVLSTPTPIGRLISRYASSTASDNKEGASGGQIIFYDIPSRLPQCAWSPNTWKTRFSLNYKGIPYKTQWIEYPDIETHCRDLGIAPTAKKSNGSAVYTLPAIHDPSTGKYVSDSLAIAQYLEITYPSTPKLFPDNTLGLQTAFIYAYGHQMTSMWQFAYAPECSMLNPPSAEYFRRTREEMFGRSLEDLVPQGEKGEAEWAKFRAGLGRVDGWYAKTGGPFLLGDAPSWADFVVASHVIWWKNVWGEESKQWNDVSKWHGGRWNAILENLKDYQQVV